MIHGLLMARGPAVWYLFPSGLWVSYQWFNMQKSRIIETTVVAWRSIGQFEMIRFLYCEQLSLWINTEWMTSLRKRKQSIVLECALLYRCRKTLDGLDRAGLPQKGHKHRLHQSRPSRAWQVILYPGQDVSGSEWFLSAPPSQSCFFKNRPSSLNFTLIWLTASCVLLTGSL